jgi:cobalt-zinc-cadmium efflux system outer membrane protein
LIELEPRPAFDLPRLVAGALEHRPDLKAAGAAQAAGQARLSSAQREAYPDLTLGATYTHSAFTISGDNPNSLALTLGLPLPLFDRNQANIGRARLDIRRAENDAARLRLVVENDVAEAVLRARRSQILLAVFQRPNADASATATADPGGMLARAETAVKVAEKSYKAGAISLLELLDAQRTYLDTRGQFLRALHESRQAAIDVDHAVGE